MFDEFATTFINSNRNEAQHKIHNRTRCASISIKLNYMKLNLTYIGR